MVATPTATSNGQRDTRLDCMIWIWPQFWLLSNVWPVLNPHVESMMQVPVNCRINCVDVIQFFQSFYKRSLQSLKTLSCKGRDDSCPVDCDCGYCKSAVPFADTKPDGPYHPCMHGGRCQITEATRRSCQSCRYRACVRANMSTDATGIKRLKKGEHLRGRVVDTLLWNIQSWFWSIEYVHTASDPKHARHYQGNSSDECDLFYGLDRLEERDLNSSRETGSTMNTFRSVSMPEPANWINTEFAHKKRHFCHQFFVWMAAFESK